MSFCNWKLKEINLFAPYCFISVLWLSTPVWGWILLVLNLVSGVLDFCKPGDKIGFKTVGWSYSLTKFMLDPWVGERRWRTKCWSWPFVLCLLYFNLVTGCMIWCPSALRILRRSIRNLGCLYICLPVHSLPVCKWILLMSSLTGDLGSRWMG